MFMKATFIQEPKPVIISYKAAIWEASTSLLLLHCYRGRQSGLKTGSVVVLKIHQMEETYRTGLTISSPGSFV